MTIQQKYKKLRFPKYYKDVFKKACECNDKGKLFNIGSGKESGSRIFFYILPLVHKDSKNNEYVYLDKQRERIIRTGLESGYGKLTTKIVLEWIEQYEKDMKEHEINVSTNRKKAGEKRRKTLQRKKKAC